LNLLNPYFVKGKHVLRREREKETQRAERTKEEPKDGKDKGTEEPKGG
jgi:hypothetical protein